MCDSLDNLAMMLILRSRLLGFAFRSERERWLTLTPKRWVQLTLIAVFLIAAVSRLWWLAAASTILFLVLGLLYSWARRTGYTTFIPLPTIDHLSASTSLSTDCKIPVRGTGHFLFGEVERRFTLAAGECWSLPVGDVAFMFEVAPERFAYQFISRKSVEEVRLGELWLANSHLPTIEVTFESDWLAADDQLVSMWGNPSEEPEKKTGRRTILLSFDDFDSAMRVWEKLKSVV